MERIDEDAAAPVPGAAHGGGIERQLMAQILDQSSAVVFWKDLDGRYLFVNREFCRLTRRPLQEIIGRRDIDVMPAAIAARLRANDAQVIEACGTVTFEEQVEFGGQARTYLVNKFPLLDAAGRPYAVCGIATDISARKRVEDALQQASLAVSGAHGPNIFQELVRCLAALLDTELAFIAVRTTDDAERMHVRAMLLDEQMQQDFDYCLAGTPCATVVGQQFRIYPDHLAQHFPADSDFARLGMRGYAGYPLTDGHGRPLGLIAAVSRRALGDAGFIESVMKIFAVRAAAELERERMDGALRASEESYRAIFEASEDCIFIHDLDSGAFVDVNPKACQVYGHDRATLLRLRAGDLGSGEAPYTEADANRWLDRARAGEVVRFEWQRRNADRSEHWDEVFLKRVRLAGIDRILAVTRDITARKLADAERSRFEAQLRQAQKMEAIGHLAGGIAHDFNNILTSINGYLALAGERQAELGDARLARYLGQAELAARRARDLIRQLLTFSRGQRGTPRPLALGRLVEEVSHFLGPMLPATIAFGVAPDSSGGASDGNRVGASGDGASGDGTSGGSGSDGGSAGAHTAAECTAADGADARGASDCVLADPVQLEQVLMNLCINARDALQGRGRIRIAVTPLATVAGVCASCRGAVDGRFVTLRVADDGPGIPPEVMERMFEPFFTTKAVGKGSGMGLATVHGIVHEHGGHILIDSAPGRGTTFRVLLPALPQAAPACCGAAQAAAVPLTGRLAGRILVADDEDLVAAFLCELLEGWGLQVTRARDGATACAAFAAAAADYDLVLTDHTMPHMSGLELAREIRRLRPGTPVILLTGYADGITPEALRAAGVAQLLHKPVEPGTLFGHLASCLGGGI